MPAGAADRVEVRPRPAAPALGGRLVARLAAVILAAALAVTLHAGLELRGLYGDASNYLVRLLSVDGFAMWEPPRRAVNALQQLPLLAAIRFDLVDLRGAGLLYSTTLLALPLALTGLSWFCLPRGRRHLFAFPLLHYLAGTLTAAIYAQTEGSIPAAYFWILFFLVLFRGRRPATAPAVLAAALPFFYSHEAMLPLSLLLAGCAGWRARRAPSPAGRAVFAILAAWFAACAAMQLRWIVVPRDLVNREESLLGLLRFEWLVSDGAFNAPAALAVLALLALAALKALERNQGGSRRGAAAIVVAFAAAAVAAVAATVAAEGRLYAPWAQGVARNLPAAVSLVLAAVLLWSLAPARAAWAAVSPRGAAVIAMLAASSLAWHVLATRQWSLFADEFVALLRAKEGLVARREALALLKPAARRRYELSAPRHTAPALSIVLAPGGRVATIVDVDPRTRWRPFDPAMAASLPRSRLFDLAPYLAALARAREDRFR